ncbi:MAG: hypothetical protein RIR97_33, partial [Pseudomonadota bacterium]
MTDGKEDGRLALIAGGGKLPVYVAEAARRSGHSPVILALRNEADQDWSGFEHITLGIADMQALSAALKTYHIRRVILSGAVRRRPEWRDIRPTWTSLSHVPTMIRTLRSGGDNAMLMAVISLIESLDCRVLGVQDVAPDLLVETGCLTRSRPKPEDMDDIGAASYAASMIGRLDIGQGSVSVGGRVVALEGAEGTDGMLERVAMIRAQGRISQRRKGVLVKLCKPQQDERADLPAIGRQTVEKA